MSNKTMMKKGDLYGGWRERIKYSWGNALRDLLRQPLTNFLIIIVIAISITLPTICYLVWKNVEQAANSWYPTPQLTVFLDKSLSDDRAEAVAKQLKQLKGVDKINYLSREDALNEFRSWSGFSSALDMLDENPLPAIVLVSPKIDFQHTAVLNSLKSQIEKVDDINEVRMDDSWFAKLVALTHLVGMIVTIIAILMIISVFLIIGNSVRLNILNRRKTIEVMKLIGATDGFILRPFLSGGVLLGVIGACFSLLFSSLFVWYLTPIVNNVTNIFGISFYVQGMYWEENIIILLVSAIIGWGAAWLSTRQQLRRVS